MSFNVVFNQMIVLFLLMLTGYITVKNKIADREFQGKLSGFILWVTQPLAIIASVSGDTVQGDIRSVVTVILTTLSMFVLLPLLGTIINFIIRVPKEDWNVYLFMTIFSNKGFFGFPVIASIFGNGALFYVSIVLLVFNLLNFTLGIYLMTGQKGNFRIKGLINPGMVSSILALVIFLFKIPVHPIIYKYTKMLGDTTSPIAMTVIGMSLAQIPLTDLFSDKRLFAYTPLKQLAVPAVYYLLLRNIITDPYILGIMVIITSMPVAAMAVIFAEQYKKNQELATKGVFITTITSMLTIPLISAFLLR